MGIGQHFSKIGGEARGVRAVDNPMIVRQRQGQHEARQECAALVYGLQGGTRHAEDRHLRRIDDRRERRAANAAEARNGECAALHLRHGEPTGARLHASWVNLPHVTQFDEADITDLEDLRNKLKLKATEQGIKLTPLAFIIRACVRALHHFPTFNSSLDAAGENLVLKKYVHMGFAADTPNGLMVPVVRDADRKDIYEVARALGELSEKARTGTLNLAQMQGGSFTISSLGGIGGTAFTPIINAPEVAILGVSRSVMKPVFKDGAFVPRLMLPLSLSYDHRVIDGALAAKFTTYLAKVLSEPRSLVEAVP